MSASRRTPVLKWYAGKVNLTQWTQGLDQQAVCRQFGEGSCRSRRCGPAPGREPATPDVQVMTGHGGRLGRVDTELAGAVLGAHGRRLVVLDPGGAGDDLVRDMTGVLTSFRARRYGRRPA